MGIDQIITWYQKKIGTYDKQLWEKTIEQRILRGLANIQFINAVRKRSMCNTERDDDYDDLHMKPTRLKTEFIDIDLVRGSSFTKTKPKHGFVTVARLATLRFLLFPFYSKWWILQTSGKAFLLLLILYLGQLLNIGIYSYNVSKLPHDSIEHVPCSEIVVPILLMWILSLLHSQIVSTQSDVKKSFRQTQKRRNFRRRRKGKVMPTTKTGSSILINESSDSVKSNKPRFCNTPKCVIFKSVTERLCESPTLTSTVGLPLVDDGFESFNGNVSTATDTPEEYVAAVSTHSSHTNLNYNEEVNNKNSDESDVSLEHKTKVAETEGKNLRPNYNVNMYSRQLRKNSGKLKFDVGASKNETVRKYSKRNRKTSETSVADSTSCDSEDGETMSSPDVGDTSMPNFTEATTSATEWMGVTTNTEDCSYSSELEPSDTDILWDTGFAPTEILSPYASSDRVSCTVWNRNESRKVDMSAFDISCEIISRVEEVVESIDYFYFGMFYAILIALFPALCRLSNAAMDSVSTGDVQFSIVEISGLILDKLSGSMMAILDASLGSTLWERFVMFIALCQRYILTCLYFFLLSVAERTFKQRFLYAKMFSHLTSSRRARKSQLPHFRLNKVRNIKTWLSVRSFLKKRGPQRSVDVIVSSAFVITLLLLSLLSIELLKDSGALNTQYNIEALLWCFGLGCLLLRFMTLGTKINEKYRSNLSVLITEQINLYLQIEQNPEKKEELNVANSVLKLAADLLKELETPFKISGFSTNPHIYTITKVFVLSALSGVLSEMLGFKLKLHKIKIK